MKILFTGKGSAGSWKIRGEQLGNAVGEAIPNAPLEKIEEADLVVWVKKPAPLLSEIIRMEKKWVWDLVDFYPQPVCSNWDMNQTIEWAKRQINRYSPNEIIYANKRMQEDIGYPGITVHHHHWPDAKPIKVKKEIKKVGYQGCKEYLDIWKVKLIDLCKHRGWEFVINPKCLSEVDVVVAFRGGQYNGYAQSHWKSNVKLCNAHAYGLPFIGLPEPGYIETQHSYDQFVVNVQQLSRAFDRLTYEFRQKCNAFGPIYAVDLEQSASLMKNYLHAVQG